jgi:hypothetical protein
MHSVAAELSDNASRLHVIRASKEFTRNKDAGLLCCANLTDKSLPVMRRWRLAERWMLPP